MQGICIVLFTELYCLLHCTVYCIVLFTAFYCLLHCTVDCIVLFTVLYSLLTNNGQRRLESSGVTVAHLCRGGGAAAGGVVVEERVGEAVGGGVGDDAER